MFSKKELNVNISYYQKKKITNYIINFFMFILLFLTLFPIVWMIYNAFMSNQNISLGKIKIGRSPNHTIITKKIDNDKLLMGTSDGSVNIFDQKNNRLVKRKTFKTFATNIKPLDNNKILISSGDKGFFEYDIKNGETRHLNLSWQKFFKETLFINQIASTVMVVDPKQRKVWTTISYSNYGNIIEIDLDDFKISKVININGLFGFSYEKISISSLEKLGDKLFVGTNKGILQINVRTGVFGHTYGEEIFKGKDIEHLRKITEKNIILATDYDIFSFDIETGKISPIFSMNRNSVYSKVITALNINDNNIFIGFNIGFFIIDKYGNLLKQATGAFFKEVDQDGNIVGKGDLVEGDILGFSFISDKKIVLESLYGRFSIFDLQTDKIIKTGIITKKGYLDFRWRNFIDLWNNIDFGLYLRNSFIICLSTMFITMILATLTAYALVRFPFPGSRTMSIAILSTQMIPGVMFLIPIHIMFTNFTRVTGIPVHGTFGGIIFIYSAFFLPFSVWILRSFFSAIPVALEEAATIDGCSAFQVFTKISLPLAVPGIIATGIFVFLVAWDELMFAWILTSAETMTIPVGIRLFVGNFQNRFDLMMAASTVATIPVMFIFFLLQRYIVSGLTAGAVKE